MTPARAILLLPSCALLFAACGGTETVQEEAAPPTPPPAQVTPKKTEFETRTDTVDAAKSGERSQPAAVQHEPQIRFMVQIGAFKDPANASRVQTAARERFHLPVINDFHMKRGLYQIRLGFFERRADATAFRARMISDYPKEYTDSWIVQLKR